MERIVDRSKGHVPVDPNTLHPPALSPDSNDRFVGTRASRTRVGWLSRRTWRLRARTAVACFVRVTLGDRFVNGDGSLFANGATGKPDDFFGYDCPQGFTVKDFTNNRWIAVRYFDSNLNQIGTSVRPIRRHQLQLHHREGGRDARQLHRNRYHATGRRGQQTTNTTKFLGKRLRSSHWPARSRPGEQVPVELITPPGWGDGFSTSTGPHPIDAFYAGDPSGILPVCNALR